MTRITSNVYFFAAILLAHAPLFAAQKMKHFATAEARDAYFAQQKRTYIDDSIKVNLLPEDKRQIPLQKQEELLKSSQESVSKETEAHRQEIEAKSKKFLHNLELLNIGLKLPARPQEICRIYNSKDGYQSKYSNEAENIFHQKVDERNALIQEFVEKQQLAATYTTFKLLVPCALILFFLYSFRPHLEATPIFNSDGSSAGHTRVLRLGNFDASMLATPLVFPKVFEHVVFPFVNVTGRYQKSRNLKRELAQLDNKIETLNNQLYPTTTHEDNPHADPYHPTLWHITRMYQDIR